MRYWIGLGANLGDRLASLRSAAERLSAVGTIVARSRVYSSPPVGPPQPDYLNAALTLDAELSPEALLDRCQEIESQLGRTREIHWGPRTIDVDLLLIGDRGQLRVDLPRLTIPHAHLHERGFALAPLVDLDATLEHPISNRTLGALLSKVVSPVATGDRL